MDQPKTSHLKTRNLFSMYLFCGCNRLEQGTMTVGVSESSVKSTLQRRIGLDDWTMWPLLRPGCIVRINTRHKVIARHGSWSNDYDRPIYFLEIRDGFPCGWCDLHDRQLLLTLHSPIASLYQIFHDRS